MIRIFLMTVTTRLGRNDHNHKLEATKAYYLPSTKRHRMFIWTRRQRKGGRQSNLLGLEYGNRYDLLSLYLFRLKSTGMDPGSQSRVRIVFPFRAGPLAVEIATGLSTLQWRQRLTALPAHGLMESWSKQTWRSGHVAPAPPSVRFPRRPHC